jgi:ATP-dependent helicase/nuclease subunit A
VDAAATLYAFRRNLVVAASAGTGKTHSLVGVLVHLLLGASELGGAPHDAVDPARVVATTFSRKAAAEIRARVAVALERLAGDPHAMYRGDLAAARERAGLAAWNDAELGRRARAALEGLPRAQIGTLHGFASSLVRRYALERGLSPSFEVVEEDVARARAEEAITRAIEAIGESRRAELSDLAAAAGGVEGLLAHVRGALARLEEDGRGVASLVLDESDARTITRQIEDVVDHARAIASLPKYAPAASEVIAAWESRDEARLGPALEALCAVRAGKEPEATGWIELRDLLPGKTNPEKGRHLATRFRLREAFAVRARFARDLLLACETALRAVTGRDGGLAYGDLLRAARDLARDRPDLAAEVGASLDVALVDELQDTSRLQRDLLLLLWQRDPASRAPGEMPSVGDVRPSGLFLVGDRKQSIYAFRGADVSVFAELCVGLAGAPARRALGIEAGRTWEPEEPTADFVSLRHNRRGEPELLAMANELSARRFAPGDPPALYEIAYQPPTEDLLVPPERARVQPEELAPRTAWLRVDCDAGDGTRRLVSAPGDEARVIASRITRIVQSGAPRVHGEAPRWRDVAVLAETNRMLDHVAFALARLGVPYVVAGSGFYTAREVRDLVAMLALLLDPGDAWAILEVLRGPWAGVRDETLIALTDPHRGLARLGPAWDEGARRGAIHPEDRAALDEVRDVVLALHRDLDRLGPGRALREASRALGLEEVLVQLPRGPQRVANVRKLLAIADREPRARVLRDRLDDAADREASEGEAATFAEEDDAVRLLTVHASKGLDFPIVFVPEVGKPPRAVDREAFRIVTGAGGAASTLVARATDAAGRYHEPPSYVRAVEDAARRERAERQRLAYVAATRASHAMIFVGDRTVPQGGATSMYLATTAAALRAIAESSEARARAFLEVEDVRAADLRDDAATLASASALATARSDHDDEAPAPIRRPAWRALPIATTALQDFHHCPRRFELAHLLDLPERAPRFTVGPPRDEPSAGEGGEGGDTGAPRLDARSEGTLAHRVLEQVDPASFGHALLARAEATRVLDRAGVPPQHEKHGVILERVLRFLGGAYAERIAETRAHVEREVPFTLDVRDPEGRSVSLRGSIDLLVRYRNGAVDVIDYKSARGPSPEPHAFQLDAYALAARALVPSATRVRTGIVFLGGGADSPAWRPSGPAADVAARLAALGSRLVDARWTERFPREPLATCRAIQCGYVADCHPRARAAENVTDAP